MAQINIDTTPEEQQHILATIKTVEGETIAVSKIAKLANMNQNRVRYIIEDCLAAGTLERIPTKSFNNRYIRYCYKVL